MSLPRGTIPVGIAFVIDVYLDGAIGEFLDHFELKQVDMPAKVHAHFHPAWLVPLAVTGQRAFK
ncbi:hypothetical protein DQ400_05505 [Vreelandella sulfidaeris]|uniref:Uncharacterized protein n=1 Tax=Vreelandella sulfidaeris TaxID=115553 RepID=A0A365TS62_9GAMM|nr:hypothetical protein DQ400_05505 [Halomonas sulfidaeris]